MGRVLGRDQPTRPRSSRIRAPLTPAPRLAGSDSYIHGEYHVQRVGPNRARALQDAVQTYYPSSLTATINLYITLPDGRERRLLDLDHDFGAQLTAEALEQHARAINLGPDAASDGYQFDYLRIRNVDPTGAATRRSQSRPSTFPIASHVLICAPLQSRPHPHPRSRSQADSRTTTFPPGIPVASLQSVTVTTTTGRWGNAFARTTCSTTIIAPTSRAANPSTR